MTDIPGKIKSVVINPDQLHITFNQERDRSVAKVITLIFLFIAIGVNIFFLFQEMSLVAIIIPFVFWLLMIVIIIVLMTNSLILDFKGDKIQQIVQIDWIYSLRKKHRLVTIPIRDIEKVVGWIDPNGGGTRISLKLRNGKKIFLAMLSTFGDDIKIASILQTFLE